MHSSNPKMDHRIEVVYFTRSFLGVELKDGRIVEVPLTWFPKLLKATTEERNHWKISGGGFGIHWPDIDEDISVDGLLQGTPAFDYVPLPSKIKIGRARSRKKNPTPK